MHQMQSRPSHSGHPMLGFENRTICDRIVLQQLLVHVRIETTHLALMRQSRVQSKLEKTKKRHETDHAKRREVGEEKDCVINHTVFVT